MVIQSVVVIGFNIVEAYTWVRLSLALHLFIFCQPSGLHSINIGRCRPVVEIGESLMF